MWGEHLKCIAKLHERSKRSTHDQLRCQLIPTGGQGGTISFSQDNVRGVYYPHCDALIVRVVAA